MLSQTTIDRIVDAANIVDVVSGYVTLRKAGASYKGLCPFHDDTTPSFSVSPARGLCKCFSCGKGGNAVHFIMEMEQLGYIDALKFLAKKYNIEVEEEELTPEQLRSRGIRESLFAVNEWASQYFHDTLLNDLDGRTIGLMYFRSRGFRDDIIEKFRLGFALDKWDALAKAATKAGYQEEYLIKTGLCSRYEGKPLTDRYRGRVMFPWFTVSGKIVAFGGRVLDSRTKGVNQKYINSTDSDIYHKANELYGLYQAKRAIAKEDRVYMVEGYTDVISMHQCGVENVVANSGTALSEAQIHLLHRFTSNITLLYDGDAAGIKAALRGTDMLLADGMNVKILLLPDGDDPDSFARKHNAQEYRQYIEEHQEDFITFKINHLLSDAGRDPVKRAQVIKDIVQSVSLIPEEIVRMAYLHQCSEMLGIHEDILLRESTKNRKKASPLPASPSRGGALNQGADVTQTTPPEGPPPDLWADEDIPPSEALYTTPSSQLVTSPMGGGREGASVTSPSGGGREGAFPSGGGREGAVGREGASFYPLERLIMTLIVRYGEQLITGQDEEGNDVSIPLIQYVNDELAADELCFETPLYAQMLADGMAHLTNEGFQCSRFYMNSPNGDISLEAVNLMSDRYQLSKGQQMAPERDLAPDYIIHLMLDYKWAVIKAELDTCRHDLTRPEVTSDPQALTDTMTRFHQLSTLNRELAKRLGERVVIAHF